MRTLFFASLLAACTTSTVASVPAPAHMRHVIVVSIDGLKPDAYMRPDAHGLRVPTLRRLAAEGARAPEGMTSVFPTVTYPSHTSMVTGVMPARHGIMTNHVFDPEGRDHGGWRWYAEDIHVDPVWRIAERAGDHVATVWWPVTTGAEVTWRVPEYWRAKDANDQKLIRALSTPGLLDAVAREHPDFWPRFTIPADDDSALTDIAIHILETGKPSLLLLHLIEVDGKQHEHGVWSPEANAAIEKDDAQLARVLDAVKRAGIADDTDLIVVSDHGFLDAPKVVEPCVLLRDAGLVALDARGGVASWKAAIDNSGGQAYVYLNVGEGDGTRSAAREAFATRLASPDSGIARIYDVAEIATLGGDPHAAFAVEAAPGFQFGAACSGEYAGRAPTHSATHGYDPRRPEMRASLLLYGPHVPRGDLRDARVVDVGPTVAAWLGLAMPNVDGKPLVAPR
jgi:predicted AlkP superfamily pyrophosphatase or phosphodiesterase